MSRILFTRERALFLRETETLVLGDLHLGFEYELLASGISIPSQTGALSRRIAQLVHELGAERLVILGDVKHSISFTPHRTARELRVFFSSLEFVDIHIAKGNHDGGIEKELTRMGGRRICVHPSRGFVMGKFGFAHGHARIGSEFSGVRYLFLAHEHPSIEFSDGFSVFNEPCWLVVKPGRCAFTDILPEHRIKKCIIFPAFNPLLGGVSVNRRDYSPMGPNARELELSGARVYLHEGTYLGRLKNLFL